MRLQHAFYKFPFRFDAPRMRAEIDALPEECWQWHHENFKGNSALHLITTGGTINDSFSPPMKATELLERLPYVMQAMSQFRTLMGRARLMRLEPGDGVPAHSDIQYYWRSHTRVHIPVFTHPDIRFHCGDDSIHMAEGEAWTFDNWRNHKVVNDTPTRRIHLTFDTYGSASFWSMARPLGAEITEQFVPYQEGARPALAYENYVDGPVMSPSELELEISRYVADVAANPANDRTSVTRLNSLMYAFRDEWRVLWHAVGPSEASLPAFQNLLQRIAHEATSAQPARMQMASNGWSAGDVLRSILTAVIKVPVKPLASIPLPRFDQPVFIVSAPRSGSTLLFETLAASDDFWTLGDEGHAHVEQIGSLEPGQRGMDSNRLTVDDATDAVAEQLRANYTADLRDAGGRRYRDLQTWPDAVRFLEKTPKNALRIPFLRRIFPDAKFIFLHREANANISAIMEAWRSGGFVTYPNLPDWKGPPWSMLLIPGWRELIGADLAKIALRQWRDTNETIMADLAALPSEDWCSVRYEDFIRDPAHTVARLCEFAGVGVGERLRSVTSAPLRPSRYTLTAPNAQKWRANEATIAPHLGEARTTIATLARLSGNAALAAAQ